MFKVGEIWKMAGRPKGSTNKKKSTTKKSTVNKKISFLNEDDNYCVAQLSEKCKENNGIRNKKYFYMATNKDMFLNGRLHICKDCMKEYCYIDGNFNIDRLKHLLMMCDLPLIKDNLESAIRDKKETVGIYLKNIQLNYKNFTWKNSDNDENVEFNVEEKPDIIDFKVTDEVIKFWGKNYNRDDYITLQQYYNELCEAFKPKLPTEKNNYKNYAKTQLLADKCLEKNDLAGYDKAMRTLSMISGDSNIKPSQGSNVEGGVKGGYDAFIGHIENDEPIFDWEKDLGFKDAVKSLLNIYFFGHLARVLGIQNPFATEYDEEMRSYTVSSDEIEEEKNQIDFLSRDDG